MRVLLAPDSFGGTMSAPEAAAAMAAGWREVARADEIVRLPMSDGGPGFVDVLAASIPGERRDHDVPGPLGAPTRATVLHAGDTAYVEAAQAAGLHLVPPAERDPRRTTSYGVGVLLATARDAARVVVGLGGTATNDGGAGLWAALGAEPAGLLRSGGAALIDLGEPADPGALVPPARPPAGLVAATDVDNPLLGPTGASAVYGPQKGADRAAVLDLDDALRRWADAVEAVTGHPGLRDEPGAGAAGGLGFGLFALGATRVSGVGLVADAVRLTDHAAAVDLVVTGEGSFDEQSLRGKVVAGVAAAAQAAGVPCVVLAGRVCVGRREAAAAGIEDVYAVSDLLGSAERALSAGADGLAALATHVARLWSRA